MTSLLTGQSILRKYLHKFGISKDEPICRVCNEEDDPVLGPISLLTGLPERFTTTSKRNQSIHGKKFIRHERIQKVIGSGVKGISIKT